MFKRGLVLGKFMPFHRGHEYLIRFAQKHCWHLDVVVCSMRSEPIGGQRRYYHVNDTVGMLNGVQVHWFQNDLQPEPKGVDDEAFWASWVKAMTEEIHWRAQEPLPIHYDALFASEDYAWRFAKELGAEYYPVNPNRSIVPVSGTAIRNNPFKYWDYISEKARRDYVHKIVVVGPESTGKSTLCQNLAQRYKTIYVPEYGRDFYEMRGWDHRHYKFEHMEMIAQDHDISINEAIRSANKRLFIDTDIFATMLFSEIYFGKVAESLREIARHWKPNLTLVCKPNVEWVKDPLRDLPHMREEFFQRYLALLDHYHLRYKIIDEIDFEDREYQATTFIDKLTQPDEMAA